MAGTISASSSNGALLSLYGLSSPEGAPTAIANLGDYGGFGIDSTKIDVSNHNDTSGFMRFVLGLRDAGEVSGDIFWNPLDSTHNGTAAQGLWALAKAQSLRHWKLTDNRNSSSYFQFYAYVKTVKFSKPVNGAQKASFTLAIDGEMVHSSES